MPYRKNEPSLLQTILASHWTQAVLLLLIAGMGWQVYDRFTIERSVAERRADTEVELQNLQAQRAELAEQVENMQDDFGIETEIRQNFDVAREGEQIVIILDDDLDSVPEREGPSIDDDTENSKARWYEFWQ